jgi:hypothetical protein
MFMITQLLALCGAVWMRASSSFIFFELVSLEKVLTFREKAWQQISIFFPFFLCGRHTAWEAPHYQRQGALRNYAYDGKPFRYKANLEHGEGALVVVGRQSGVRLRVPHLVERLLRGLWSMRSSQCP